MSSIIMALTNLSCKLTNDITEVISSRILANVMGDSLHSYIESLFIDNILSLTSEEINIRKQEIFSWAGNQNNIPDLILKGSDAIEIKKIEATGSLALNSSYPKQTLSNTSSMITDACKNSKVTI